ncbi:31042_t:CDS:2 [Gigaspora margarita]|uniref:31042_t:CDS:1 n=1 Tax=Gigaspora margarita TaxID=4874 RepID=A0ABN7VQZ3_GIGMA|nr:31042_t:CDS:2 [Gigaspora margarita]
MKYNFSTFTISIIFGILFLTLISSTQGACSVGLGKGDCQAGDVCVTAADCAEANSLCKIGLGIIHCITTLSDGCLVAGFAGNCKNGDRCFDFRDCESKICCQEKCSDKC